MNWGELASITAVVAGLVTVMGWIISSKLDTLKAQIGEWREHDKREVREWINGSFLRAGEVKVRIDGLCDRIESVERTVGGRK